MFDNPLAPDTPLEVTRYQYAIFEKMGMAMRGKLGLQLSEDLRRIAEAGVKLRHPSYSPRQVMLTVLKRAWGQELFSKVYPNVEIEL